MRPKLLRTLNVGEFVPATFEGKNESGFEPIGDHVLVLPDKASDTSSGGISFTAEQVERTTLSAETGVMVALGPDAYLWNGDRTRHYEGRKPRPGDRIYMARYSGQVMLGKDGQHYRCMSDNCIAAIEIPDEFPIRKLRGPDLIVSRDLAKKIKEGMSP